jgi:hypothetical protein
VLIDGGASHNFIDSALLKRRHIPTVEFEGFKVEVAGGSTMPCDRYIPGMKLTLGRHELVQDVYVMDLPDTNIILGVQWLSHVGAYHHQLQDHGDVIYRGGWTKKGIHLANPQ